MYGRAKGTPNHYWPRTIFFHTWINAGQRIQRGQCPIGHRGNFHKSVCPSVFWKANALECFLRPSEAPLSPLRLPGTPEASEVPWDTSEAIWGPLRVSKAQRGPPSPLRGPSEAIWQLGGIETIDFNNFLLKSIVSIKYFIETIDFNKIFYWNQLFQ